MKKVRLSKKLRATSGKLELAELVWSRGYMQDGSAVFKLDVVEQYFKERMDQYDSLPRSVRDVIKRGGN